MELDSQNAPRYERPLIAGLCIVAAVRIFIFSAAFPFFNNCDEQAHFDMVYKYSRGHLPPSPLKFSSRYPFLPAHITGFIPAGRDKNPLYPGGMVVNL